MGRKAFAPLNCTSQVWRPTGWQWQRIFSFFLEYLVVVFIFSILSFNFFYDHFFTCPHFSSKCYLIGLSTESWNIMTLKVVKATVLMVRSFNENWPTKISTMTMKWKLSDKASQWNLQLVSTVPIYINETFNWYPLFLYVILEIKIFPGSCDDTVNAYLS